MRARDSSFPSIVARGFFIAFEADSGAVFAREPTRTRGALEVAQEIAGNSLSVAPPEKAHVYMSL